MVKRFVLDISVILTDPKSATEGFEDNHVIILAATLAQLEREKEIGGERGYNAVRFLRELDDLRSKGDLVNGIRLDNGGMLILEPFGGSKELLPKGYDMNSTTNKILSACLYLQHKVDNLILVTNNASMRISASALKIDTQSYFNSQTEESNYKGYRKVAFDTHDIELLDKGLIPVNKLKTSIETPLFENEYLIVTDAEGNKTHLAVHKRGDIIGLQENKVFGNVAPKNEAQFFALNALLDPDIPLVILSGAAGTAKTFLSLAAGLTQTYTSQRKRGLYQKIVISRPSTHNYKELGALPGGLEEKLEPLLAAYFDNLETLLSLDTVEEPNQIKMQMEEIIDEYIEVFSLEFVRGRSLSKSFFICDEAQNASRLLIKDVITRIGQGSKLVIAGDPNQIDMPTLDKRNNGLIYSIESMKNSPLCSIIRFDNSHSVRSPLSKEAIKRMVL